jgi:hypothetical protein
MAFRGRVRLPIVLPIVVAVAAMMLAFRAPAATEPVLRATPCGPVAIADHAQSKLRVVGNHMEAGGKLFVPYGISLVSGPETRNWARSEKAAAAQIIAAHRYWHANAVRIQVSESQLLDHPTPGYGYDTGFAASVNRLVCRVFRQGQIPIINDTTLFTTESRGPTERTVRFWKFMSERYGNRLPVIFDLFDEPRLARNLRTNRFLRPSHVWRLWERGGHVAGKRYLSMQRLVDTIRITQRVDNVIWVEEPWYLDVHRLLTEQLPEHLLRGRDIVYAFHKATLAPRSRSFRNLEALARLGIPFVDSEWSQFAATDRPWECQDGAYRGAPRFLAFLRRVPIGLIAWSLQPGALVEGRPGVDTVHDGNDYRYTTNPADLAKPNVMTRSYGCNRASRGQGAGALIQEYFSRYSKRPPAALLPRFA